PPQPQVAQPQPVNPLLALLASATFNLPVKLENAKPTLAQNLVLLTNREKTKIIYPPQTERRQQRELKKLNLDVHKLNRFLYYWGQRQQDGLRLMQQLAPNVYDDLHNEFNEPKTEKLTNPLLRLDPRLVAMLRLHNPGFLNVPVES